jgi:3alpha(or 20beta)-hydroxysteroid dehydrogenase
VSSDRIALVTGAARGQGAAIVKRLSKDGFRVAACDLLVDDLNAAVEALGNDTVIAISRRDGRRPMGHRGGLDS